MTIDYATLARIEDHLRRIADALEGAHPAKYNPGGLVQPPWDIGSVPNRVELEPVPNQPGVFRRVTHAAWDDCETRRDPNQCDPGCTRPSLHDGDRTTPCAATMPGHRCTRAEHSDDRHVWAMSDEEAQRILRAGQELGFVAEADPLDESDHRPRHDRDVRHWRKGGRWWDTGKSGYGNWTLGEIAAALGPLTFCDCDDTTTEAENGATD